MVYLTLGGVPIDFPFRPYDVQEAYMERVIECLQKVCCITSRLIVSGNRLCGESLHILLLSNNVCRVNSVITVKY